MCVLRISIKKVIIFCSAVLLLCGSSYAEEQIYLVNAKTLNVRACPEKNCKIIGKIIQNERVTVIDSDNKWAKIIINEKDTGFVASKYLEKCEAEANTVEERVIIPIQPFDYKLAIEKTWKYFLAVFGLTVLVAAAMLFFKKK